MSAQRTPSPNFVIHQNEPEGWKKAFEVTSAGVHVAWFQFRDSADAYLTDRAALANAGAA